MKLREVCSWLDAEIPLSFQESYDNSGLQLGQPEQDLSSGIICIDVTEEVVDEAVSLGCNLIVSHHPLIFGGIKKISGRNSVERIIHKCIKNDIAVYSAHTNLDASGAAVSRIMAEKLGLTDITVLVPLEKRLLKLVTFVPESHLGKVRDAVFDAGAGVIGKYDRCGFTAEGKGSFRAGEDANPFAGKRGEMHFENEVRFETVLYTHMRDRVVEALLASHPYEEVAYDLYSLENRNSGAGFGCTGIFSEPVGEAVFLDMVARTFGAEGVRYSALTGRPVRKAAVCGGSGAQFLRDAIASGADAFVTADIKYHAFFEPEGKLLLIDAGHYETEKFATEILKDLIIKKFPKFALSFSETNTNPINYF